MKILKLIIDSISSFFSKGNERSTKAKKNIVVSFVTKVTSIFIGFLVVPLTLGYVGKEEYGIWLAISTLIQWFAFFDVGLGNGLRNKLAEAIALGDEESALSYISSSYAILTLASLFMFALFVIISFIISWNSVLNTEILSNQELRQIVILVFLFFCIGFVFNVTNSILAASQNYAIVDLLALLAQLLGLGGLFILVKTTEGSLFLLCLVFGSKTAIVMLFATVSLFLGRLRKFRPRIKNISFKKSLPLLNLGLKFFFMQIFYLVVNNTSLILVIQFFGPSDVIVYNLAFRYIAITSMGYIMILTPFLSAFTDAYTKNEFSWIRSIMKKINIIWLLFSLLTLIMIIGYKSFFLFWVGPTVSIPVQLVIAFGLLSIINTLSGTYGLFLNGVGKVNLQLFILGGMAILFLPLSYLFYSLHFGLISIVLPQIFFGLLGVILLRKQYNLIINNKAIGLWSK